MEETPVSRLARKAGLDSPQAVKAVIRRAVIVTVGTAFFCWFFTNPTVNHMLIVLFAD